MGHSKERGVLNSEVCQVHKWCIWDRRKCPVYRGVLNSEVVKYTNGASGTDESVLFIEVALQSYMYSVAQVTCLWTVLSKGCG